MPTTEDFNAAADNLIDTITAFRKLDISDDAEFRKHYGINDYGWNLIQKYRRRIGVQKARAAADTYITGLQERLCEETIHVFLECHFKGATNKERELVREQIAKEVDQPKVYFDYALSRMVRDGVPGIRRLRWRRPLRHFRHTWEAMKAVIAIIVVLAIYERLQTDFETIVCSLLILLYTQAIRAIWGLALQGASFRQASYMSYIALKETMKTEATPDEIDGVALLDEGIKKSETRRHVVDTGNSIINLIVFWHLFKLIF
jgi:hypothetical protein